MKSESRKKKLELLTKSLARGDIAGASELLRSRGHSGVNRHGATAESVAADGSSKGTSADGGTAGPRGPLSLADACGGSETEADVPSAAKPYWTIRKTLAQVDPEGGAIAAQYASVMRGARQRLDELEASPALCHVAAARPEDLLFMDIESCGLYGASVFLIGLMYFQDGQLLFEQCLARNYAEEPAVLQSFASRLEQTGALVTFNGRAFDMNMIRDRCAFHRLDLDDARLPHLDLLHECRRRWRGRLPNCRLQTLEAHLCGRQRVGDIPGWAIPDAYHRFVDTGDARQLRDILHHNLLDLLTMAQILNLVLTGQDPVSSA